jgi:hypothetical protein
MSKLTVAQLAEILEKFQEAISHLQKEVKELRTECDSNKVTSSKLKIYIDELHSLTNENIAMLDKRIQTSSIETKPPVQKTTITVSRAAEVYKQFKQKQNGN